MADQGIVVLGVPRSGTTLLRRLLDAHPDLHCGGETFLLRAAARFLEGDLVADGIDYGVIGGLKSAGIGEAELLERLRTMVFGLFAASAERAGKRRWVSKTAVDAFHAATLERLLGDRVRWVIVLRHGLDVAASLKDLLDESETAIGELRPYLAAEPRPVVAMACAWAEASEALLGLAARQPALVLRYEELVADPARALAALGEHVGERFDEGLIARALGDLRVKGLGDQRSYQRQTIDASSVGRWRKLSATTVALAAPHVAATLARCGYPPLAAPAMPDPDQALRRYELATMVKATPKE